MPCLLILLALGLPRLAIVLLFLFSDYLSRAIHSGLWLILGFFFMPFTTLAYAFAKNHHGSVDGWYLALVIVAVLLDFGALGGGTEARKRHRPDRLLP
jgi:hypothetical protein